MGDLFFPFIPEIAESPEATVPLVLRISSLGGDTFFPWAWISNHRRDFSPLPLAISGVSANLPCPSLLLCPVAVPFPTASIAPQPPKKPRDCLSPFFDRKFTLVFPFFLLICSVIMVGLDSRYFSLFLSPPMTIQLDSSSKLFGPFILGGQLDGRAGLFSSTPSRALRRRYERPFP